MPAQAKRQDEVPLRENFYFTRCVIIERVYM